MTFYRERVSNNTTYLYEIHSYRDKKTGKVKHKERCLGKIDEDGTLITKKRKLPDEVVKNRKVIVKSKPRILKNKKTIVYLFRFTRADTLPSTPSDTQED